MLHVHCRPERKLGGSSDPAEHWRLHDPSPVVLASSFHRRQPGCAGWRRAMWSQSGRCRGFQIIPSCCCPSWWASLSSKFLPLVLPASLLWTTATCFCPSDGTWPLLTLWMSWYGRRPHRQRPTAASDGSRLVLKPHRG